MTRIAVTLVVALLVTSLPAKAADKTDVVIFVNGDRLTGEVRSLERGKLRFNTDATGTISIEWDEIVSLASDQNIQVETEDGDFYFGKLSAAADDRRIVVTTDAGPVDLAAEQVVIMTPIEATLKERIDGAITAGYTFAKASEVRQLVLGLEVAYRTELRKLGMRFDATSSNSEDNEASQRESLAIDYTRFWENRWLTGAVIRLESNDQLGIDLRTSIGAGGGRILRQTNSTALSLTGGLQVSRENVSGAESDEDTLEAFGTIAWDWFRYDSPEVDFSTNLQVIPNLTDAGRVRAEFDVKLKWEVIDDLFWQLSVYDSYDSDPVIVDAEKNDYGINTSLGWTF